MINDIEYLRSLLTIQWREARKHRGHLTDILLHEAGFGTLEDFLREVGPRTTVVTIVGGAASRWDKSFDDPTGNEIAKRYGIIRGRSRFLAPVPNLLPDRTSEGFIPILTYNLAAIKPLLVSPQGSPRASHVLIYSKDEERNEIKALAQSVGIPHTLLCKQEIHPGRTKPSGHADALLQHLDVIVSSQYVVTQFGCDVSNTETIIVSLLCLYVMEKSGEAIDVILPTAAMEVPKYPVFIDGNGVPRQFGHEKLLGKDSLHTDSQSLTLGGSNIGLRVYSARALKKALLALEAQYARKEEFALDNVDQYFATMGTIRQLCIGLPEEISHAAKTLTEIPYFLENEAKILSDANSGQR